MRSRGLGVGLAQAVDRVADHAGQCRSVDLVQRGLEVRGRRTGIDAHQVQLGCVGRLQFGGRRHGTPALGVPPQADRPVGGDGRGGQALGRPDRIEHRVRLREAVDVGVVARRPETVVVGDDDGDALQQHGVDRQQFVLGEQVERRGVGHERVQLLGRRTLVALALGARRDRDERPRTGTVPGQRRLEVGAADGVGVAVRIVAAVEQPGALCREHALRRRDADGEVGRSAAEYGAGGAGQVERRIVEVRVRARRRRRREHRSRQRRGRRRGADPSSGAPHPHPHPHPHGPFTGRCPCVGRHKRYAL